MEYKGFEGWYFKHEKNGEILAFIVGRAESGAFVQMISQDVSRYYCVERFSNQNGIIRADNCIFTRSGCSVDLPGIKGTLLYGQLTPLSSDIMGPLKFFPMECRHGIISMTHGIRGSVALEQKTICFDGGKGYIEGDSGTSFPESYLRLHCGSFRQELSAMLSVARIPLFDTAFTGCISAILFEGREFKLATYLGARILSRESRHICIAQGSLLLEADISASDEGHLLSSPEKGKMTGIVRESCSTGIRLRLYEHGKPLFDEKSGNCSFELLPGIFE